MTGGDSTARAITSVRIRRLAPVAAALTVGLASLRPASFPLQGLLETLAIAQASLLAIVISVSMMSMQVSTNRFAPQLAQLYRERGFNAIIARFGVSILLDLALFALPPALAERAVVRATAVTLAVGLAAWAFVALLDIEERLLVFLNPDPVLDELVDGVSFERYRSFASERREAGRVTRNPILEILQIAETSLEQRDNYSALRAVEALDEATERLLADYTDLSPDDRRRSADSVHKLFDYWNRLADLAVDRGADDVLHAVVDAELAIGTEAIELELEPVATGAVDAVFHFCAVTLANNRLEPGYHAALGELLSASLDERLLDVARRAVTDLARLSRLVDRREDDLLVAADERITPHVEFFDNWVHFIRVHHPRMETDPCQSLYVHFERQYRTIRDEATVEDPTGPFYSAATTGFRDLGVAAAEADVQWVVSRSTRQLLALMLDAGGTEPFDVEPFEELVAAGGAAGVRDAATRIRRGADPSARASTTSGRIDDPLSDRDHTVPAGPGHASTGELDAAIRELERVVSAAGAD